MKLFSAKVVVIFGPIILLISPTLPMAFVLNFSKLFGFSSVDVVCLLLFSRVSPSLVRFSAFAGLFEEIMSNPAYLDGVLAEGPKKAAVADATLINVYQAIRFLRN